MRRVCAGLAVLALAVAGCGGDDGGGGGADTGTTEEQQTDTAVQAGAEGKQLFTENCGGCHTLADAGTNGQQAPNLDEAKPDEATVQTQVTNGGGGMPAFKDRLSEQQIQAVAAYVSSVAGQ
jgi:cbb3-type cytochrome c oxidase subunit III